MLTITRTPLSLVTNTHYAMDGDQRRATRRTSARLSEKENHAPTANGIEDDEVATSHSKGRSSKTAKGGGGGGGEGGGGSSAGGGRGKRKQAHDEEDNDGFVFSRTKSKRTKTAAAERVPEPVAEDPVQEEDARELEAVAKPAPKKRGRKRLDETKASQRDQPRAEEDAPAPRRRSTRNSGDKNQLDPAPARIEVKKHRSKARTPDVTGNSDHQDEEREEQQQQAEQRGRSKQKQAPEPEARTTPVAPAPMKIALPFADTPIIRRNQEMRKGTNNGSRRSSLGNRGRRASSLIDSGRSALPHDEVASDDFFKHIESGLPEPRRMRQLLTWCATRALGDKPAGGGGRDVGVRMAAREIQNQILRDFGVRSEMSDWFGREDAPEEVQKEKEAVKRPNPRNVANQAKIEELEAQLARLQVERTTWERLLRPPSKEPILTAPPASLPDVTTIDQSLLTPGNAAILERLRGGDPVTDEQQQQSSSAAAAVVAIAPALQRRTRTALDRATAGLEFEADQLADSVHALGQFRRAAERAAARVLDNAAAALDVRARTERERSGTADVPVRDVLRGLSRVEHR